MSGFREIASKMCINPDLVDKYAAEIVRDDVIADIESDGDRVFIRRRD
tara:strand:+ start:3405 stop:3548 length:144 start_codon:yes stop_codon:yes gene_type:complete